MFLESYQVAIECKESLLRERHKNEDARRATGGEARDRERVLAEEGTGNAHGAERGTQMPLVLIREIHKAAPVSRLSVLFARDKNSTARPTALLERAAPCINKGCNNFAKS
jgi:hypothetical protein